MKKEEDIFDQVHQSSKLNFIEWESFTRSNQLESLIHEKEKRDKVYLELKEKIKNIKQDGPQGDKLVGEQLKKELFGNSFNIKKLETDALIPQQHYINLYILATKSEKELDRFYLKGDSYLRFMIKTVNHQINLFENKIISPKKARKYEKNNFTKYYSEYNTLKEKVLEADKKEENINLKKTRAELLNALSFKRKTLYDTNLQTAETMKRVEIYSKIKSYDMNNLTEVQLKDLEDERNRILNETHLNNYFSQEYQNSYVEIIKNGNLRKVADWNKLEKFKKNFIERKQVKLHYEVPRGEFVIENLNFLSQSELGYSVQDLEEIVSKQDVDHMNEMKEKEISKEKFIQDVQIYEKMLKNYYNRQVKKNRKPDIQDLNSTRDEIFKKEMH
jgi:hypothetical protein